jgi:hypothetical protein
MRQACRQRPKLENETMARFICEVDDCFELAVVFVQGRLLCSAHASPYIRASARRTIVEPARADWLRPKIVQTRPPKQT